jgi:hypothetical protein
MTIFRIVSNLGTYIGVYDRFFGFRLSNNRYALIENIPVNRNESHQYEPIVNLTSKINENLFTTYSRVNNFDINIINYILNLFGKNVPSDFSSITTLM